VIDSSTSMSKSPKLKQLLEIILALGNFMNRGQRGNATGFKLSSVNNMIDTKSSVDRNITLLHYLVDVLEKRVSKSRMKRNITLLYYVIGILKQGQVKSCVNRKILHYLVDVLEKRVRCGVLMERPVLCVIFLSSRFIPVIQIRYILIKDHILNL